MERPMQMPLPPPNGSQRTLSRAVYLRGVGLHGGEPVEVKVRPAPEDTGIVFVRTDLPQGVLLEARADQVSSTFLATTLGKDGVTLATVEHALSAISGLGIDNLFIDVDGPELPILDGSAKPWVHALLEGGVKYQAKKRRWIKIREAVKVKDGDKYAVLRPRDPALSPGLHVRCTIDYDHPLIDRQEFQFHLNPRAYVDEVASARTFGFKQEVNALRQMGRALGGSLENAVVLDDFHVMNDGGLRFSDEFVRHKALDAVGDMALLGRPVDGELICHKAGHALHTRLCQTLMERPSAYVEVEPGFGRGRSG
jgi:UDP-3-O-[3-hydroxymyristoyl] N-acetylglucosamine deacetylase